jgi:hypothetical protein
MPVIRAVRPTDLVALASLDNRTCPNEARGCEQIGKEEAGSRPIEKAVEQWFSFATGRRTWVSVEGTTVKGLLSARRRSFRTTWEVDCLVDASDGEDEIVISLLEEASRDAVRKGVERVFLRLCKGSPILPVATKAGFTAYVTERLYTCRSPKITVRAPKRDDLALRKKTRSDDFGLFQLYNICAPETIRAAEGMTFGEWKANGERKWLESRISQQVLEREGRIMASARMAVNADVARFDLMLHPQEHAKQDAILDLLLARLAGADLILVLLPKYAEGMARSLLRRGFQPGQEYSLLLKKTMVPVKAAQLAPAI